MEGNAILTSIFLLQIYVIRYIKVCLYETTLFQSKSARIIFSSMLETHRKQYATKIYFQMFDLR